MQTRFGHLAHEPARDGPVIWSCVRGAGAPTIVFEAGGGEDASVWSDLEARVRAELHVRTVVYDRAGLGRSAPRSGAYGIDAEADALRHLLDHHAIERPLVLVAHSYGGFVATLVAALDPRVAGVVLVDANLPAFFDPARLRRLDETYRPQFAALEQAAPELARVLIPVIESYPATVARVGEVEIPAELPVVDIVAETTWVETPEDVAAARRAHADFVAASPRRRAVFADRSGHHVMHDRPDLVIAAIRDVVDDVRSAATP